MSTKRKPQARRAWVPMTRATPVPFTPRQVAEMAALMGDDDAARMAEERARAEMWVNDLYVVVVKRADTGHVSELSIRRQDRKAVHDWRHFQRIKSEIAGPEVEAIELYPAESRLMDTANSYWLYCAPPGVTVEAGYIGPRNVNNGGLVNSQQRPVPEDWRVTDPLRVESDRGE